MLKTKFKKFNKKALAIELVMVVMLVTFMLTTLLVSTSLFSTKFSNTFLDEIQIRAQLDSLGNEFLQSLSDQEFSDLQDKYSGEFSLSLTKDLEQKQWTFKATRNGQDSVALEILLKVEDNQFTILKWSY